MLIIQCHIIGYWEEFWIVYFFPWFYHSDDHFLDILQRNWPSHEQLILPCVDHVDWHKQLISGPQTRPLYAHCKLYPLLPLITVYHHISIVLTKSIQVFILYKGPCKNEASTSRLEGSVPAKASSSEVFPAPGGPKSSVILKTSGIR